MKRKLRIISILLILCMLAVVFTGCSQKGTEAPAASPNASSAPQTGSPSEAPAETPFEELDPVVIKFATATNEGEQGEEAAQRFVALVEERSNGQITFEYYNSAQLGSQIELAESMSLGTLDAGKLDPTLMDSYIPEFKLLTLPFLLFFSREKNIRTQKSQYRIRRFGDMF